MCHEIRAFIPGLPRHLYAFPRPAGHAAAVTRSPASSAGCVGWQLHRNELRCASFSSVNTSDCSGTSAHCLHRGRYNTSPFQGFLQEVSNLQLESHTATPETVPQLRPWVAKRQFCTSNTVGEGDRLVLGKGDRVTPQRPVSHLGTGQLQQMPPHRKEHL